MNVIDSHDLEYMQDVGVPASEVAWLATQIATQRPFDAEAKVRAQRIENLAYEGLLATIRPSHGSLRVSQ